MLFESEFKEDIKPSTYLDDNQEIEEPFQFYNYKNFFNKYSQVTKKLSNILNKENLKEIDTSELVDYRKQTNANFLNFT